MWEAIPTKCACVRGKVRKGAKEKKATHAEGIFLLQKAEAYFS